MHARTDQSALIARLTALSDLARLRILSALALEELSVGEMANALQMPQSTVSRHLKLLLEGGWVVKRAAGTASLYRLDAGLLDPESGELWDVAHRQLGDHPALEEDAARLAEVIAERRLDSKAFFDRVAGDWDQLRQELFGSAFTAEALAGLLPREWVVADIGCGTGNAAEQVAPFVKGVILVDRESAMLEAARARLAECANIECRQGDLSDLPIEDREVDAVLLVLVLHHVPAPGRALAEVARTLRPGGRLLVVDMVHHDRESYRYTMGHQHLGFDESDLAAWARDAGLRQALFRRLRPAVAGHGPGLFVATMIRDD